MSVSIAVDQRLAKKEERERERDKKEKQKKEEKSGGLPLKARESIKALKGT